MKNKSPGHGASLQRLIMKGCLFAAGAALLGCGPSDVPKDSADHTREIISAALAEMDYVGVPPPPPKPGEGAVAKPRRDVLISSTSLCFGSNGTPKEADCTFTERGGIESPGLDDSVPKELRTKLLQSNSVRQPLDLSGLPRVRVVDAVETAKLVNYRSWKDFYDRYPGTAGWVETSLPVLSSDESHALVYFEHRCDGLCGTGTLIYLEHTSQGWVVVKQLGLWIN